MGKTILSGNRPIRVIGLPVLFCVFFIVSVDELRGYLLRHHPVFYQAMMVYFGSLAVIVALNRITTAPRRLLTKWPFWKVAWSMLLVTFAFVFLVSYSMSPQTKLLHAGYLSFLSFVFLFPLVTNREAEVFLKSLAITILSMQLVGLIHFSLSADADRFKGLFAHPNTTALMSCAALAIVLFQFRQVRWVFFFGQACALTSLYFTESRIGIAVGGVTWVGYWVYELLRSRRFWVLGVSSVFAILGSVVFYESLIAFISRGQNLKILLSLNSRLYIWKAYLRVVDHNFWWGTGQPKHEVFAYTIGGARHAYAIATTVAHNLILNHMVVHGVPVASCLSVFYLFSLQKRITYPRDNRGSKRRVVNSLLLVLALQFIVVLSFNWMSTVMDNSKTFLFFFTVCAGLFFHSDESG